MRFATWKSQIERSQFGLEDARTYREAVVRWTTEVLPRNFKPQTARRYSTSLISLDATFDRLTLPQITSRAIADYISSRTAMVSNATLRRDLTALSRLLSACVSWGWTAENPAHAFDRSIIRERRAPIRPPEPADVDTFCQWAPPAMASLVQLLAATGMRENEAITLERGHIDWQAERILLTTTKSGRARSIAWRTPSGDATQVIRGAVVTLGTPLLFPTADGTAYAAFASGFGTVMRRVVEIEADAGRPFRRFRAHDLRHGFAIRWLRAGGDLYRLSKHLGHSSVKTTEGYLAYLTGEEQDAVVSAHGQKAAQR